MDKRLTKEELKRPDEFVTFMDRLATFVSGHAQSIGLGVLIIFISTGSFLVFSSWKNKKNLAAADALTVILKNYPVDEVNNNVEEGAKGSKPISWDKFITEVDHFLKDHRGTSVARSALLYKAKALMKTGNFESAHKVYEELYPNLSKPYTYLAKEGQALSLMERKKWVEAEKIWTDLSKGEDNPFRAYHLWNLGLTQEGASKVEEAVKTYRDFESRFPNAALLEKVRARLAILKQDR